MTALNPKTALVLIPLVVAGCHRKSGSMQMPAPQIEVFQTIRDSVSNQMEFIGQTGSNSEVTIQPRISGYLVSKHFGSGMPVKKGQLLFKIDPSLLETEVAKSKASLASAQAQLIEATNNYNRAVPLAKINAISQSQLDQYRAQFVSAEANEKASSSQLRNAQLELGYTTIYSPIDGIIAASNPSVGDYVGTGTKYTVLTTISNTDSVSVKLPLPVSEYLKITGITEIKPSYDNSHLLSDITLILSDGTVYPYKGKYSYTEKDVSSDMGTIIFKVLFPNPARSLKPGQFARVSADVGPRHTALLVPQQSVSQSQDVNSVWVMKPDSTVEYRSVTLGPVHGPYWEIASGIEAGEWVLTTGQLKMHQGMKIKPVTAAEAAREEAMMEKEAEMKAEQAKPATGTGQHK